MWASRVIWRMGSRCVAAQEQRRKRAERGKVLAELKERTASTDQLKLLQSSACIGMRQSKKQKLRGALQRERAGIAVDSDKALLYRPRRVPSESSPHEDEEEGEEEGVGVAEVTAPSPAPTPARAPEPAPAPAPPPAPSPHEAERKAASAKPAAGRGTAPLVAKPAKPAQFVLVDRTPEVQEARMKLPVCQSEQEVMEAIMEHDVVLLCGETGSGKTTQLPQFLYEAGYGRAECGHRGMVGITQPRRVAAVSMAKRVAHELNQTCSAAPRGRDSREVAYQIRYDARTVGANTRVKFMTDGVLLRELQSDLLLRQYSAIVLDEAHERGLNTDLLLGLLSRVVPLRRRLAEQAGAQRAQRRKRRRARTEQELSVSGVTPLKLIVMSATLRVSDFTENRRLFSAPPPVVHIGARQHPVTVHFNRRTVLQDYTKAAVGKALKVGRGGAQPCAAAV